MMIRGRMSHARVAQSILAVLRATGGSTFNDLYAHQAIAPVRKTKPNLRWHLNQMLHEKTVVNAGEAANGHAIYCAAGEGTDVVVTRRHSPAAEEAVRLSAPISSIGIEIAEGSRVTFTINGQRIDLAAVPRR